VQVDRLSLDITLVTIHTRLVHNDRRSTNMRQRKAEGKGFLIIEPPTTETAGRTELVPGTD
jgi:hypothetical protein